ncbi:MAG: hypothetical protein B7Y45_06980 [Sphingomonas sp. 28-66-16]|nr:MAG: hypothetical protein B7Y45_06980 [Sphingomonas sp. 28-66-16]
MPVSISSAVRRRLIEDAAMTPDAEICGLLFGTAASIESVLGCRNVAPDPATGFEIDPAALLAAHRAARQGGPAIIGHYHSHPRGSAIPSARDAAAAHGDAMLWLVIAADDLRLWRAAIGGSHLGAFEPVPLRGGAACANGPASP